MITERTYILVLGTADWNQAIATNQHYVVAELCRGEAAEVTFVESLGLRRPTLSVRDLSRVLRRARRAAGSGSRGGSRAIPGRLRVVSPLTVPLHLGVTRWINRRLLARQVREWLGAPGRRVLWTYTPVTYGLEVRADMAAYHCVDLLGKFPGIDESLIDASESRLAEIGVTAIASSPVVAEHLSERGFEEVMLWENVADVDTIRAAMPEDAGRDPRRVVFAGNLTANKVDFDLLVRLAGAGWTVEVAGPIAEGGGADSGAVARLRAAGVKHVGMLSLPELAMWMATATVGLVPYRSNEYTRGVSPLKTFEYLAAGLGVVSIGVPSVTPLSGHVEAVATADAFVEAVERLSNAPMSASLVEARQRIASEHSWRRRGEQVRALVGLQRDTGLENPS